MVMQEIVDMARNNGGLVTTRQVVGAGMPRARLSDLVKAGELERVQRGVYRLTEAWEDEFLAMQLRFPKGIFSDGTALYLYNFTDRMPFSLTMTFPRSYKATKAREAGVEARSCADEVFELGVTTVKTPYDNEVRVYDLERTLCDLVRGRKFIDVQVVNPAMKAYARKRGRDLHKLLKYACALGVEKKIRTYMEVLL